jgi:tetraacyldisaccharide 4'-kinase
VDWRTSPLIATWWGERRDPWRGLLRLPLIPPAGLLALAAKVRAAAYARGWRHRLRLPVPTISVGNLTVGGTGKSPTVRWLARRLVARGLRPIVFSSGFGSRSIDGRLDEEGAALLAALPEARILQARDRGATLARAFEDGARPADVVVLDDGFQKLWIERDLDVVMLDATRPFGPGWVVPAGPLRECRSALRRAGVVILSRSDLVQPEALAALRREVAAVAPRAIVCVQRHRAATLLFSGAPASSLVGRRVYLLSAIAHPRAFDATVAACGAVVVGHDAFRDHASLPRRSVMGVVDRARRAGADLVLCTAKDAPKIGRDAALSLPIDALDVDVAFDDGGAALDARLSQLFESTRHAVPTHEA